MKGCEGAVKGATGGSLADLLRTGGPLPLETASRLDKSGGIAIQVWDRDASPTAFALNYRRWVAGTQLAGKVWRLAMQTRLGNLVVESYEELRFASGYVLPSAPPGVSQRSGN